MRKQYLAYSQPRDSLDNVVKFLLCQYAATAEAWLRVGILTEIKTTAGFYKVKQTTDDFRNYVNWYFARLGVPSDIDTTVWVEFVNDPKFEIRLNLLDLQTLLAFVHPLITSEKGIIEIITTVPTDPSVNHGGRFA
jgi:hypothetical protein